MHVIPFNLTYPHPEKRDKTVQFAECISWLSEKLRTKAKVKSRRHTNPSAKKHGVFNEVFNIDAVNILIG